MDGRSVVHVCVCVSPSAMALIPLTTEPIIEEPCDEELENGWEAIAEQHNGNSRPPPALHINFPGPVADPEVRHVLEAQARYHHELGEHMGVLGQGMEVFMGRLRECKCVVTAWHDGLAERACVCDQCTASADEHQCGEIRVRMALEASCMECMTALEGRMMCTKAVQAADGQRLVTCKAQLRDLSARLAGLEETVTEMGHCMLVAEVRGTTLELRREAMQSRLEQDERAHKSDVD